MVLGLLAPPLCDLVFMEYLGFFIILSLIAWVEYVRRYPMGHLGGIEESDIVPVSGFRFNGENS